MAERKKARYINFFQEAIICGVWYRESGNENKVVYETKHERFINDKGIKVLHDRNHYMGEESWSLSIRGHLCLGSLLSELASA